MQQIYYCPNCRAQVAWGQPYCTNCNAVLTWPSVQSQGQYQQNTGQQQWDQQQQWYQTSPDNQASGWGGQGQQKKTKEGPGLLQQIKDNKGIIIKISAALIVVVVLIAAINAFQGEVKKWFTAPVVEYFDTSTTSVTIGQSATVQWNVIGANSVTINPDIGTVASSGSRAVSPNTTTTYALEAKSIAGTARKLITIKVTGPLPTIGSFSFNTDSVISGQSATLSWNVQDATSVSIEPGIGTVAASGTKNVTPGADTTYTLTATNEDGNSTATASIKVSASNAPIISTFSISPESIMAGESATLTWDVIGAKSISINQSIGGVTAKGSMKISPTATTTYTLTADSSYSSVTRSVAIAVDTSNLSTAAKTAINTNPPTITSFTASRTSIVLAENSTLTWAVTGARTVTISPEVGTVPASGSTLVVPSATTTYTLSAANSFGTQKATVTITTSTVSDGTAPVIKSFTAAPPSISTGASSNLTWDIQGATTITINEGIGIPASHFSQVVTPSVTTTYVLTALNSTGTDNRTVTVTVTP